MAMIIQFKRQQAVDHPAPMDVLLAQFCDHLIVYHGLKHTSVETMRRTVRKVLVDMDSARPTISQMEAHMSWVHRQPYTANHVNNVALSIERYAGFLKTPIKFGRKKKPRRVHMDILTPAEVAVILAATKNTREKAMLALLAYSGLRNQEVCDLVAGDIDFGINEVLVANGKGGKSRVVNIDGMCSNVLQAYLQAFPRGEKEYLFTTLRHGHQFTTYALRRRVKAVVGRTGISKRVYPHLFRHSNASHLIDGGANPRTVQFQLGHAYLETTMIYVETRPQRVKFEYQACMPSYL